MFLAFEETEQSKIFPNEAFGYWKITVERPLRLARSILSARRWTHSTRPATRRKRSRWPIWCDRVAGATRPGPHLDFNRCSWRACEADADQHGVKLTAKRLKLLQAELAATRRGRGAGHPEDQQAGQGGGGPAVRPL